MHAFRLTRRHAEMATVSLGAIRPSEPRCTRQARSRSVQRAAYLLTTEGSACVLARKVTAVARPKSAIERGIDSSAAELLVPVSGGPTARVDRARPTSSLAAHAPSPPGARTGGLGAEELRRPVHQDLANCTRKPNQPALSLKLRVRCGPALRTHLRRQGVAVEEEMTVQRSMHACRQVCLQPSYLK